MSPPTVIRLTPADAARYAKLRRQMLEDSPWAFAASPDEDPSRDIDLVAAKLAEAQNEIFAVEAPAEPDASSASASRSEKRLVAAAGVVRRAQRKFAHRALIWGVFVAPERRGQGLGRAVVAAALDEARHWTGVDYVDISASVSSPEARRLYERLGFEAWGREPDALEHEGKRYDEIHMTLRL